MSSEADHEDGERTMSAEDVRSNARGESRTKTPVSPAAPSDTTASPTRTLWDVTYPIIISSLVPIMLTLVDSALLGRFSTEALAAVAVAAPIYLLGSVLALGWSIATQALTSQRFGAGDHDAPGNVLAVSLVFTIGSTLVMSAALIALAPTIVSLLTDDLDQRSLSTTFLRIVSLSLPFLAVTATYRAFYAGRGMTRIAMYVAIGVTTANIPLSYLLILELGLGVTGAALGTLTATSLGAAGMIGYGYRKLGDVVMPFGNLTHAAWREWAPQIWKIGWPEVAMVGLGYFTGVLLVGIVAPLGTEDVAALRLVQNAFVVIWSVVFACSTGISIMVGQRLGAKDTAGVMAYQRSGFWMMAALAAVLVTPLLIPQTLFGLFTPDREVVSVAGSTGYLFIVLSPLMVPAMVMAGALRAAGETRSILIASTIADYACFLPLAWLLAGPAGLGVPGVYAGFIGYWLVRLVVTYRLYARGRWRTGLETETTVT